MPHTIEPATSGRSNCRGCGEPIAKDELRFGERLPNAFGDGEMTIWFHLMCAACKRPESLLEVLGTADAVADATTLRAVAEHACAHPRLTRIGGLERAPSGRARCRACRELVEKNAWRIALVSSRIVCSAPAASCTSSAPRGTLKHLRSSTIYATLPARSASRKWARSRKRYALDRLGCSRCGETTPYLLACIANAVFWGRRFGTSRTSRYRQQWHARVGSILAHPRRRQTRSEPDVADP